MSKVLTSLELYSIIAELKSLVGSRVSKIKQPDSHTIILQLFKTGGQKFNLKIDSGIGMYVTSYKFKAPMMPPSFCLFLRKNLNNSRLIDIYQKDLERIVEFKFETQVGIRILICELFSKGNFILCDEKYKIINLASIQKWKDRIVKRNETYQYPPTQGYNLFVLSRADLKQAFSASPQTEIVRILAHFGFGGAYAEQICYLSKVDKTKHVSDLSPQEFENIFLVSNQLAGGIRVNKFKPTIYYDGSIPIDATPIELHVIEGDRKSAPSFNHALDILFTTKETHEIKSKSEEKYHQESDRIQTIISSQQEIVKQYQQEYERHKHLADQIYNNYQTIARIFNKLKQAVDSGYDWYSVYQVLENEKRQGIYEAQLVKELKPETRQIVLNLQPEITLDLTKSLEENAGLFYNRAKEFATKLEGAQRAIEAHQEKLEELKSKKTQMISSIESEAPKLIVPKKQEWYEKFRWFFTSSGLLAIGGRDATSNEIIIKKHMEIKDLVFHTEIAGSPFFLLKDGRDTATIEDKEEVAKATVSFSSAWKLGLSNEDVFWVFPEQVSKSARAGEYLTKGGFMINGKKHFSRNVPLGIVVGVDKDKRIISGPRSTISKRSDGVATVSLGDMKKSDAAKKVAHILEVKDKLDDIMRALPAGEFSIS